jgi:hypothetical protein
MRSLLARARSGRGGGRIGLILTLIVLAAIVYALVKYVPVRIQRAEFIDYIEEKTRTMIALQGTEEQLMEDILTYAKREQIPVGEDGVHIDVGEKGITVKAHYVIVQELIGGKEWRHVIEIDKEIPRI